MPASIHPLPTSSARPLIQPDRGEWGALRAALHQRCVDQDLAELWTDLPHPDRRALMASAGFHHLDRDTRQSVETMTRHNREALRNAIHRMSQYASRLRDRLQGKRQHPSSELAGHALQALDEGNIEVARHWLAIIERGVM